MFYTGLKLILTAVALLIGCVSAGAKVYYVDSEEGITVNYVINSKEKIARVVGCDETTTKTKLTIPSKIKISGTTYTVTKIGEKAFYLSDFTTVNLPNTIVLIDKSAFAFSDLKNVNIPTGIETIGEKAFDGTNITSVTIPVSCTTIGDYAFHNSKIKTLTIVDARKNLKIGNWAFAANNITEVNLSRRVASVGEGAFANNKITKIVWDWGGTKIPDYCFSHCSQLRSIDLSFSDITSIGKYAFAECTQLISANLPSWLTSIGDYAFWGTGLESVFVPNGVTTLGESVFKSCHFLTRVFLPSTLKSIGETCFQGSELIEYVSCDASVPPVCGNSVFSNVTFTRATLSVPEACWRLYAEADTWCSFNYKGYDGIEEIGSDNPEDADAEYYDLTGRRLPTPPTDRLYIELRGGQARKVMPSMHNL